MVAAECTALLEARPIATNSDRLVKHEMSEGLEPAPQHPLSPVDSARSREFVSAITGVQICGRASNAPGGFTTMKPASSTGNSGTD